MQPLSIEFEMCILIRMMALAMLSIGITRIPTMKYDWRLTVEMGVYILHVFAFSAFFVCGYDETLTRANTHQNELWNM